jgi:acetyltransferase-like isoleucine patch superfamily enzyme
VARLVHDLVYGIVAVSLWALALAGGEVVFTLMVRLLPWPFALPLAALVTVLALLVEAAIVVAPLPRLRPGRYPVGKSAVFANWALRTIVQRVVLAPALKSTFFASHVLRWLALRALGARIAWSARVALDAELVDPCLVTVEAGARLGSGCRLSGHLVEGDRLHLGTIQVGAEALVGDEARVWPDVSIGARAQVQARSVLHAGVIIGADAQIGSDAVLDAFAAVGEGAVVGTRALVAARAVVPAGQRPATGR